MKKFPLQFVVDTTSLIGVGLFVFWTRRGGLRTQILNLFGSDASSPDLKDQVGHISDLLYYYAIIATLLSIVISLFKLLPGRFFAKLHEILPTAQDVLQLLLDLIHYLVIFTGIYVYLIHKKGLGLKNNQLVLFPFWFLVAIGLHIIGRALSAVTPKNLIFAGASNYLYTAVLGLMLAQIFGYKPFSYF